MNEYNSNLNINEIYSEYYSTEFGYIDETKCIRQGDVVVYENFSANYVPFLFVEISNVNINKYVVNNYKESGMYDYSLDDVDIAYSFVR